MLSKAGTYLRYDLAKNTRQDIHQRRYARRRAYWLVSRQAKPYRAWFAGFGLYPHGVCMIGCFRDRARRYFPYIGMTSRKTRRESAKLPWDQREIYSPGVYAFDVVSPRPKPGYIASRLRQLKRGW